MQEEWLSHASKPLGSDWTSRGWLDALAAVALRQNPTERLAVGECIRAQELQIYALLVQLMA